MLKQFGELIRKRFQFHSVIHQLVLYTLVISLIPLIINLYIVVGTAQKLIEDELMRSYGLLHEQYVTNVEYKLRLNREWASKLADNPLVRDTLYQIQNGDYNNPHLAGVQISKEVGRFLQGSTGREIINCMVYAYSGEHLVYGNKVVTADSAKIEGWYPYYCSRTGDCFVVPGSSPIIVILQKIMHIDGQNLMSSEVGFVKLDIDGKSLFDPLRGDSPDGHRYTVVVRDQGGNVIFTTHEGEIPDIAAPSGHADIFQSGDYIVSRASLAEYGLEISLLFDIHQVNARLNRLILSSAPYILFAVFVIFLLTFVYSGRFKQRIQVLINKMRKVENGDLAVREQIRGRDEIHTLDRHFNRMVHQLDKSIRRNYIQALEKNEMEFRNLQLQINPHFLYNTLETVASIAAIHDVAEICEITSRLGDIFRYSLGRDTGGLATVRQELNHTWNYVYIQKVRFGDRLEVQCNADESLMSHCIMRFLLQPLVENAILHGLAEKKDKGTLEISVRNEGGCLALSVRDDGVGMTAEQVESLAAHINSSDDVNTQTKGGIGVRNVHQRIRMLYGPGYGISIESMPGQGSCFSAVLPFREEDSHMQ